MQRKCEKSSHKKRYTSLNNFLLSKYWSNCDFGLEPLFSKPSKLVKNRKNCKTIWLVFLKILKKTLWGHQIHKKPKFPMNASSSLAAHCVSVRLSRVKKIPFCCMVRSRRPYRGARTYLRSGNILVIHTGWSKVSDCFTE